MNHRSSNITYLVLRLAVAMCFIGHGAFGIVTKASWCSYLGVIGLSTAQSYQLMPLIGSIDILLGLCMISYPVRAVPAWLVCWGFVTALMRPLSGEPVAELVERAGNFGAPLALLILSGMPSNFAGWFKLMGLPGQVDPATRQRLVICLKYTVFLLLAGHGWLNLYGKEALLTQYRSLGFDDPWQTARVVGIGEMMAAFLVFAKPLRPLLFALFLWKMGSEVFYPHYSLLEWIERGGSYGSLLALWMVTGRGAWDFYPGGGWNGRRLVEHQPRIQRA